MLSLFFTKAVISEPRYKQSSYSIEVIKGAKSQVRKIPAQPTRQLSKTEGEVYFNTNLIFDDPKVVLDPIIRFRILEHSDGETGKIWAESLMSIMKIIDQTSYELRIEKDDDSYMVIHIESNPNLNEGMRTQLNFQKFLTPIESNLSLSNFMKTQMTFSQESITEIRQFYEWVRYIYSWNNVLTT